MFLFLPPRRPSQHDRRSACEKLLLIAIVAASLCVASPVRAGGQETGQITRQWVDASGKFKVQATLIAHDERRVILLKQNGVQIEVPLEKLSVQDRAFLKQLRSGQTPTVDKPAAAERDAAPEPTPVQPAAVTESSENRAMPADRPLTSRGGEIARSLSHRTSDQPPRPTPLRVQLADWQQQLKQSLLGIRQWLDQSPPVIEPRPRQLGASTNQSARVASRSVARQSKPFPPAEIPGLEPPETKSWDTDRKPPRLLRLTEPTDPPLMEKPDRATEPPQVTSRLRSPQPEFTPIESPSTKIPTAAPDTTFAPPRVPPTLSATPAQTPVGDELALPVPGEVDMRELEQLDSSWYEMALTLNRSGNDLLTLRRCLQKFRSELPPEQVSPSLLNLFHRYFVADDNLCRLEALKTIHQLAPDQSLPYLLEAIDDASFEVRWYAYEQLATVEDPRIVKPLAAQFLSSDRAFVSAILANFGSASETLLHRHLRSSDPDVRLDVVRLLGRIGTEKSIELLSQMAVEDPSTIVRLQAGSSIRKIRAR